MHLAQESTQFSIAVYVVAESPSTIIDIFKTKYNLKVKGDRKLSYHLGADYFEDPEKGHNTPLDKNDHQELDTSEILEGDMAAKYLTIVGQLQWLVT